MSDEIDPGERTEQPTQRRRQEARARGEFARSPDLTAAMQVLAAVGALYLAGGGLAAALARSMKVAIESPLHHKVGVGSIAAQFWSLALIFGENLLPLAGIVLVSAVVVHWAQAGFTMTGVSPVPDFTRLGPLAGLRRIVSWRGIERLAATSLKLIVVCAIVAAFLLARLPEFLVAGRLDPGPLCKQLGSWVVSLGFQLAIGLAVVAALDYGFQWWMFERSLRMTRQEILEELRQSEGDPQLRKQRREAQRRLLGSRAPREPAG